MNSNEDDVLLRKSAFSKREKSSPKTTKMFFAFRFLEIFVCATVVVTFFGFLFVFSSISKARSTFLNADESAPFASISESIFSSGATSGERRVLTVDGVEFAFRWAPAGKFKMGSPAKEEGREPGELLHEVELTQGFWILETETTQEMWQTVVGENPSKFQGPRRPVDSVGLEEIDVFFRTLSERVGAPKGARFALPTEAQWEYAARAGSTGPFSSSALELEEVAWFGDQTNAGTRDVATKKPNAWGLFDMNGNLWEWCADRYDNYPTDDAGNALSAVDPTGATLEECPGDIRVDRGGCWDSQERECRNANRGFYDFDRKGPYVGFRFVYSPSND